MIVFLLFGNLKFVFFPRFASLTFASVLKFSAQAASAAPLPPPSDQPSSDSPAYIAKDPHLSSLMDKTPTSPAFTDVSLFI